MSNKTRNISIDLLPFQMRLFNKAFVEGVPYNALIGGTGCGKTYLAPRFAYLLTEYFPGEQGIVSAPTVNMLKRNPWNYTYQFLRENKIPFHYNKTDMIMELPKGTLHFISAENPDRMQGVHAKFIIGDEAGLYNRLWWDTAVQRVAYKRGQIFLFTTPYSLNWLKTEFYDKWIQNDPNFWVENPRSIDNPFYPVEEYNRAKESLPDWKFKLLFDGVFTKPAGLVYPDFEVIEPITLKKTWIHYRGIDWGWVNETAVVHIAEDPYTETLYIYKEEKKSEWAREDVYKHLSDRPWAATYADPSHSENNIYL